MNEIRIDFFRHKSTGCIYAVTMSKGNTFGHPAIIGIRMKDATWGSVAVTLTRSVDDIEIKRDLQKINIDTARRANGRVFALALLRGRDELEAAA